MPDGNYRPPVDLDGMNLEDLTALKAAVESTLTHKIAAAQTAFLAEFKERAAALRLSPDALRAALANKPRSPGPGDASKKRGRPRKAEPDPK